MKALYSKKYFNRVPETLPHMNFINGDDEEEDNNEEGEKAEMEFVNDEVEGGEEE
jgi:hypothetical protein